MDGGHGQALHDPLPNRYAGGRDGPNNERMKNG